MSVGWIRRTWVWVVAIVITVALVAAFKLTRKTEAEYFHR